MIRRPFYRILVPLAALGLAGAVVPAAGEPGEEEKAAEARLDELVDRAIDAETPFFTPRERVVIERACGYEPGSWNGSQINMIGNVFHCTNGRRVSSPEVRAVMMAAAPRIDASIDRALAQPAIREATERLDAIVDARSDARAAAREARKAR